MGRGSIGRGGPARPTAAQPQPARASNTGMSLETFKAADDNKKLAMLQRIDTMQVKGGEGNGTVYIQKFLDAIGLTEKRPEVVDEDTMEQRRKGLQDQHYYFHSDNNCALGSARQFNDQFRTGKQYASNGIYGAGTYLEAGDYTTAASARSHAQSNSHYGPLQMKVLLKNGTKRIDTAKLHTLVQQFKKKYPKAYKYLERQRFSYGGPEENLYTAVAVYNGYQVIDGPAHYHVLLDRSAAMVSRNSSSWDKWKYYGD